MHSLAVIPDVHMRRQLLRRAVELSDEGYPVLFLGDYCDNGPGPNDPGFLRELFAFARERGAPLVIGNHDLAYVYPAQGRFRYAGYEPGNADAIAEVYARYRDLLCFAHLRGPYLFSHAGVSGVLTRVLAAKYGVAGVEAVVDYLNEAQPPELFFRSPVNGGADAFDGPCWLRLPQYGGAFAEEGITQVAGHSSQARIRLKHNLLMIDVGLPLVLEW